jgi:hypothetical protein
VALVQHAQAANSLGYRLYRQINSFVLPDSGKNRQRSKTILELDFLAVAVA